MRNISGAGSEEEKSAERQKGNGMEKYYIYTYPSTWGMGSNWDAAFFTEEALKESGFAGGVWEASRAFGTKECVRVRLRKGR